MANLTYFYYNLCPKSIAKLLRYTPNGKTGTHWYLPGRFAYVIHAFRIDFEVKQWHSYCSIFKFELYLKCYEYLNLMPFILETN